MANKHDEFFHDKWLGHVQTESDGLVVAKPVLLDANCAQTQPPAVQEALRELCPQKEDGSPRSIEDLSQFFEDLLGLDSDLFDRTDSIPEDVSLYAPEGPQTLRPTFGLLQQEDPDPIEGAGTPASNAAARYVALIWDVTETDDGENLDEAIGLPLDKPESTTGEWLYPPGAKFDRLLRHCRVPVGIITNREVIRLVYAPHGESSGHITFRIDDMATVGGRPILDAMIMLLCANQWFGVSDENSLPSLLKRSREHQGSVTEDLAEQVFSGLETLLQGFQQAAERDKTDLLQQALEQDDDHLYRGLLTVMLRLVFILYAEDRSLLPVEHPLYAKRMSLLGLFERLQRDHGNFPDSMNNRFGAWGHIVSLCRVIYLGVDHGDFHIPPRQGDLFDPHRFKFLEGWTGGSAPVITQKARSEVQVPTVDDGTVFSLLRSLLIFQGQRLSYRTLDVEQIGSVYEALMGYHVKACESQAVAIKIKAKKGSPKYWLEADALQSVATAQRLKWLQNDCGFDKGTATKIKKAVDTFEKTKSEDRGTLVDALLPLAVGKKDNSVWKMAQTGQYIFQPGAERRRSGSHYTPRSLTSPIVQKTLQPLLRCLGEAPTAEQILELKLCDPAMGSGAFLVECCRQLADEVIAAWGRDKQVEEIATLCPEGDVVAHARRLVAQRCLYGVDKNVMAVQLAKLSLWLFTLARELPFTFLDHSLRYGDSLVGLNFEQIKAFNWKPEKQISFLEEEITKTLDEVVAIRQEIHALAGDSTPAGQKNKTQRLFDANDATEKVRKIADVCVGSFFSEDKNKSRLEERQRRENVVKAWLAGDDSAAVTIDSWVKVIREEHAPFHWWIEFPEVFYEKRPDPLQGGESNQAAFVDAFVGNPPFLGGRKVSGALGSNYSDWLETKHECSKNADLCAHFFRAAWSMLGPHGVAGLVATNAISEGDTRAAGLQKIISNGARVYDARCDFPWPGSATVTVSTICFAVGSPAVELSCTLNGQIVQQINSKLESRVENADPVKLDRSSKTCFQGVILGGMGFALTLEERDRFVQSRPANDVMLRPYIGGDEVNTSPTHAFDRYAIDFGGRSVEELADWPELIAHAQENVGSEREQSASYRGHPYWLYWRPRPELISALAGKTRCLVTNAQASKHLVFAWQPPDRIFANSLNIFAQEGDTFFAILQSRVHTAWAYSETSSLKTDIRYNPTKCFVSFPFPETDPRALIGELEDIGKQLYETRAKYMVDTHQGLTQTYNALRNPECEDERILELRRRHEEMDRAVADAYGWADIKVPPYCPVNGEEEAAVEAFNDEVIDRLYVLNAERAAEEEQQGLTKASIKKKSLKKRASLHPPESNPTLDLF
ncbi:MAG: N-6 DNA methylase [Pseudomonadales bacterium]|nr:N-6 DNA methylase [Pseudomonadales bacterium]